MLDARSSQLYFGPSLNTLQRGLPAIAGLLVLHYVGILRNNVYITHITDLELDDATDNLRSCNDNVIQLGPLSSRSLFRCIQISEHLLLQYSPHSVINWVQIWRIWIQQLR